MTLPRDDMALDELKWSLELCEEVSRRSRMKDYVGHTISVGVRGARLDSPIGFYRQTQLPEKTNHGPDLFQAALIFLTSIGTVTPFAASASLFRIRVGPRTAADVV